MAEELGGYPERALGNANFVFFGGSTGIGRAAAIEVARRGANLLIVGRGREAGEAAAADARSAGAASAAFLSADLSTASGIKAAADGVSAWRPALHGVMHTAMAAFQGKQVTADGLEFAFALQYFARAALNRLLVDALAASGDGRIVHIGGDVEKVVKVDLDDLQFDRRKWSFMKAILGTHLLGSLQVQQAQLLWSDRPVSLVLSCVGSTRTRAMLDPKMPWYMRLMGRFGTTPELSARNAVRLLTQEKPDGARGAIVRNPKRYLPETIALAPADAEKLWRITGDIGSRLGLPLP